MIIHYMSFPFPCLMAILIILGIITARIKYVSRKEEEQKDNFWEIEADANSTPRQDISKLDYIKIPDEILDFCELTDSEILSGARLTLDDLKEKKILNSVNTNPVKKR